MCYNVYPYNIGGTLEKLSLLDEAHLQLTKHNWSEYFIYDEASPTCLTWRYPFRKSKGGGLSKRTSMTVGGVSSDKERLVVIIDKKPRSIAKIVWIMHNGPIPLGYSVFFKDEDTLNAKISNLYVRDTRLLIKEKYCKELKDYLVYDETSPSGLRWIKRTSLGSKIKSGDVAGSLDKSDGYWKLHAFGDSYKNHRIIWYLHNGEIPEELWIDHMNGIRSDNRIGNLRLVVPALNGRNKAINKNNKTGHTGVAYSEFVNHRGTLIRRYVVTAVLNRKYKTRSFSCEKYGDDLALKLALAERDRLITEFNEQGAGYTERHGT